MSTKKPSNLLSAFKDEKAYLAKGGFYPLKIDKHKYLNGISTSTLIGMALLYIFSSLTEAYLNISDFPKFFQIISLILSEVAFVGKIINILMYKKNFFLMEDKLQNPLFSELHSDDEENILKNNLKTTSSMKTLCKVHAVLNLSIHSICPLVTKRLPLMMWFPFNETNHYYKIFVFETMLSGISLFLELIVDLLTVSFMDLCATQFLVLEKRLVEIGAKLAEENVDDKIYLKKLKDCVTQHSFIYSFSSLVEETFSTGAFLQISCSSLVVFFGVCKMLDMDLRSLEFLFMAIYMYFMVWKLGVYCYFGQRLLDASSTITNACYMSEWYNCNLEIQNNLMIIMNRGTHSVTLKAGKTFGLTLETLMTILSSAFSFFVILSQLHNAGQKQ